MGILGRKPHIEPQCFELLIDELARVFESLREEYVFGSLSQLKKEGVDVSDIPRDIVPGSELDDVLKGYQLTSMMGIAWNYIRHPNDQLDFSRRLKARLDASEGSRAWVFNEEFLDCQGDMDALAMALSVSVHRALGSPQPSARFLTQFQEGAVLLTALCQMETCKACGDEKTARSHRRAIGLPP